jgi:transposase InsO family protein
MPEEASRGRLPGPGGGSGRCRGNGTRRGSFARTTYYGAEFTAKTVREWLARVDVKTLFIAPGSPWENGYIESFNGKLRDELLDREICYTLGEAKILIERWRKEYNTFRPHSALGYRPPAPEAVQCPMPETTGIQSVATVGLT